MGVSSIPCTRECIFGNQWGSSLWGSSIGIYKVLYRKIVWTHVLIVWTLYCLFGFFLIVAFFCFCLTSFLKCTNTDVVIGRGISTQKRLDHIDYIVICIRIRKWDLSHTNDLDAESVTALVLPMKIFREAILL